jgi:hypothetical protein
MPFLNESDDGAEEAGEDKFDEGGILCSLGDKEDGGSVPLNEWCIVVFGKYGREVLQVFPITPRTGDREAVDAYRRRGMWSIGSVADTGTYEANRAANIKHFSRVMPAKDFLKIQVQVQE